MFTPTGTGGTASFKVVVGHKVVCYLVFGVSARVTVTVGWSDCDSLYLVLGNSGFLPSPP
jgi:hypothetical protein